MDVGQMVQQAEGIGADPKKIVSAVSKMVQDAGGVGAVVSRLKTGGLEQLASSWVSKGQNETPEPEKLGEALGQPRIQQVAQDAGVSETQAKQGIASLLPTLVDKLTPDGTVPADGGKGLMSELTSALG